jgi:hypothetical protein
VFIGTANPILGDRTELPFLKERGRVKGLRGGFFPFVAAAS